MKKIQELIQVINRNKVKAIEIIGKDSNSQTKTQEFYEKLTDGIFKTEQEASLYFYQKGPENRNYKALKKRLLQRLLNTTLFIDIQESQYDNASKAYYNCWKNYAIAKVLAGKGAFINAYDILKKVLKQSIKYEFTELTMDITRLMRHYNGSRILDLKAYQYYNQLFEHYQKIYEIEALADGLYTKMLTQSLMEIPKRDLVSQGNHYQQQLFPWTQKFSSYRLHLYYYLIVILKAFYENNYRLAQQTCHQAIHFLSQKTAYSSSVSAIFARQLFLIYIQQRKFPQGANLLSKAELFTPTGSLSWFTNYDYYLLLCLHTKRYQKAYQVYNLIIIHPQFKSLPPYSIERWRIYEAHLYFLIELQKIAIEKPFKFRLSKFLNEVPLSSKRKQSANIPILAIQLMFNLIRKEYHKIIDRAEALEKYCYRYLKPNYLKRSQKFLKMLLLLPKVQFYKPTLKECSKKLELELQETEIEQHQQVYKTEIIPYEDLWDFVLELIEE